MRELALGGEAMISHNNRRRSSRHTQPGGYASCLTSGSVGRYRVNDASRTGVALHGGPNIEVGTEVGVSLWWPSIGRAAAHGFVCRQDDNAGKLAVTYTDDDGMTDLVQKLRTIEQLRADEPIPLICGSHPLVSSVIDHLENAGIAFLRAKSPLDVLNHLQNPWEPITSLVFQPDPIWFSISELVGEQHPGVRRVLINSGERSTGAATVAEQSQFDRALAKPWHPHGLYDALGLDVGGTHCVCCELPLASKLSSFCALCVSRSTNLTAFDDLGGGD